MASETIYEATCSAPVNIAVVKYWGKRSPSLILPTNSSLSLTLSQDDLKSQTTARALVGKEGKDRLWLNGIEEEIKEGGRMATCLKEMRGLRAQYEATDSTLPILSTAPLHLSSVNNFPTAAGLASSASGLSCLIATLSSLYSLPTSISELSRIARQGSGSACRSMFGGFVAWDMGEKEDGSDSMARQVKDEEWWKLEALVYVVSDKKKGTASTAGMQRTIATSDLLKERIKKGGVVELRMERMEKAIAERNFEAFAEETIRDSNQFHAVCLDTNPPIFYLNDVSRSIIQVLEELNRSLGRRVAAYTFDAGPNAVVYVEPENVGLVKGVLGKYFPVEGEKGVGGELPEGFSEGVVPVQAGAVSRVIHTRVGDGPRVMKKEESLLDGEGWPKGVKKD